MKQLSLWAKNHKWASRILIVTSFILLNILGIAMGILLNSFSIIIPDIILITAVIIFITSWWVYPSKKDKENPIYRKRFYPLQKLCDFILVGSTFLMIIFFGNTGITPFSYSILNVSAADSFSLPTDSTKTYKSIEEFKKTMKDADGKPLKWKERKKLLKEQIRGIKKANNMSDTGKVFLIILCVLLAVALAYLVAALSCSLSCSGAEGAAAIVAILGIGGVAVLTFFLIRGITRKAKKKKEKAEKTETEKINN